MKTKKEAMYESLLEVADTFRTYLLIDGKDMPQLEALIKLAEDRQHDYR